MCGQEISLIESLERRLNMSCARALPSKRCIASTTSLRQCRSVAARSARTTAVSVRAEVSYVMVKPDGVQRGLVGEIISRFERKGFKLKGLKMISCPRSLAENHYKDLSSKPFYNDLVNYILSGPVVCIVRFNLYLSGILCAFRPLFVLPRKHKRLKESMNTRLLTLHSASL